MKMENVTFQTMSYYLRMKNCYDEIFTDDRSENYCFKRPYSQVPIKRVGPNKQVGWIFYVK